MQIKKRHVAMARAAWRAWSESWAPTPAHISHAMWRWHRAAKGKHQ